jgi:hypothetical protein
MKKTYIRNLIKCDKFCVTIFSSFKPAVLNLWSANPWGLVTPIQGARDCLGKEINHFLVAPISQYTTYMFHNFITYRTNRNRTL